MSVMKSLMMLTSGLCAALLLFGCKNDDLKKRVDDLENRVEQLEEFCRRMNANIEAIQSLVDVLSEADRITAVVPVRSGSETIGYTITFEKGEPITIYHGKNAVAPVIGIRQDVDERYYWTLDGDWLLDDEARKVPVNGEDGMTPQLKIEKDCWYVSYDGTNWSELGKVAEGEDNGIFRSVTADDEYAYFTLIDGTVLTVPLVGEGAVDVILFEDDLVKSICVSRWDTDKDGELSVSEAGAVTSLRKAFNAKPIRHFREFAYFTGVTALSESEFCDCDELESIVFPANLATIGDWAFSWCLSLTSVECKGENPPTIGADIFDGIPASDYVIRVPGSAVERYKTAAGWSDYASQIVAAE